MSPDSLSLLEPFVSRNSRLRGEAYAADRRVRITVRASEDDPALRAEVAGTDVYYITLRPHDHALDVSCDCPHFEREADVCKHIWATIIEAVRTRAFGDAIFDELHGAGIEEGFDNLDVFERVTPMPRIPEWKRQLQSAGSSWEPSSDRALPPNFELRYTLVLMPYTASLQIGVRTPKMSGELSKPRAMDIPLADIPHLPDDTDRQVLSWLSNDIPRYASLPSRRDITPSALRYIAPTLAATGRLFVEDGTSPAHAVTWSDEAWQFVLSVAARERHYELTGFLRRNGVRRAIHDVTLGPGVALDGSELAPLDDAGAPGLLRLAAQPQALIVPIAEGDELVQTLMTCTPLPELHLPKELSIDIRRPDPLPVLRVSAVAEGGGFTAAVVFDYAGTEFEYGSPETHFYDSEERRAIVRNAEQERKAVAMLPTVGFRRSYGSGYAIGAKQLWKALPPLIEAGWQVEGGEGVYRIGGELSLSIASGIDWFDLHATVRFGSASAELPQIVNAIRRGDAFVPLDDGSLGLIDDDWRARLEPFAGSAAEQKKSALRFRSNQAVLVDALLAGRADVEFDEVFERARGRLSEVHAAAEDAPASFRGTLREYQREGLGWMSFLRQLGFGGCLADDMGLGKTVQVLAMLEGRRGEGAERPSLVVAPRSLIFNWKSEAARFTPELRVLEHASPERSRSHDDFHAADLVLTTYGTLRRDAAIFAAAEFDYVVLDEAQAIKNAASQSARTARLLRAQHRLALSGTPIENHVGELWSLFEFLNPGMLGGSGSRVPEWLKNAAGRGEDAQRARELVGRVLRPFILRRTKAEVARELPDRVEQTIVCELEAKQRAFYDELRHSYRASLLQRVESDGINRSRMHVLEALLRLRQAACHPALVSPRHAAAGSAKVEALMSELDVLLEENHKVLVFSQFTSFLALIREQLDESGIAYEYLDGKTRDRAERVRRFQEDPAVPLFLISLKAGGLGLNLTAAEYVFLLDPWWNPAVEAQAIDRAHRIGQDRTVVAYRLVARDTIEEKILQLQSDKRALADAILTEDNSVVRDLSAEDLDLLLS